MGVDEVGEEAVAVSLNFGALQEGVGTIPHAQSTLSREEKWRVERILAGEEADDAEEGWQWAYWVGGAACFAPCAACLGVLACTVCRKEDSE